MHLRRRCLDVALRDRLSRRGQRTLERRKRCHLAGPRPRPVDLASLDQPGARTILAPYPVHRHGAADNRYRGNDPDNAGGPEPWHAGADPLTVERSGVRRVGKVNQRERTRIMAIKKSGSAKWTGT